MASNRYSPEETEENNANGGFVMDEEDSDAKDVEIVDLHGKLATSLKTNVSRRGNIEGAASDSCNYSIFCRESRKRSLHTRV